MFAIREAFPDDLDQLHDVARFLDTINLPNDRKLLEEIIALSTRSFSGELPPMEREYLFVLEDLEARKLVGTSMIHAQHGTRRSPHTFFEVSKEERYSESLDRYFVHECLKIGYEYDGPTEIGGLILLPSYRGRPEALGKLLSYVRFLFIGMHRTWFRDTVLSELLPPLGADGTSVLWEALGRQFTGLTYQEADRLSKHNKEFIRTLFPHGLIYISLLPKPVQEVIGQVGPQTRGVEKMLTRIGLKYQGRIDPFDGGPHYGAPTDQVTLVRDTRHGRVAQAPRIESEHDTTAELPWAIVAAERADQGAFGPSAGGAVRASPPPRFRATLARQPAGAREELELGEGARKVLGVAPGDPVAWVSV